MKKIKGLLSIALSLIVVGGLLSGCGQKSEEGKKVKIGITGDASIDPKSPWAHVKAELAKENIELEFVGFGDYNRPNIALAEGEIDLNSFQHKAFLESFKKDHKIDIVSIGNTNLAPMGIYSKKIKGVKDIKEKGKVIIPNDKSNGGRAFLLLETAGLIKLKDGVGYYPTKKDIIENSRNLEIIEVAAAQIPRCLDDTDIAIINNGVATLAGLNPLKDPIFLEDAKSEKTEPYINIIAAREEDKDNPIYKRIIEIYHRDKIKEITNEFYKGSVIPAW